jgi:hypothetical protein
MGCSRSPRFWSRRVAVGFDLAVLPSQSYRQAEHDHRRPTAIRALITQRRQPALRISTPSTSVTVVTSGAGCSITSTTAGSTAAATGCFILSADFFATARLGFAFARLATFARTEGRAFPRLADFRFGNFPRFFCAFDFFLRLAMIAPAGCCWPIKR